MSYNGAGAAGIGDRIMIIYPAVRPVNKRYTIYGIRYKVYGIRYKVYGVRYKAEDKKMRR